MVPFPWEVDSLMAATTKKNSAVAPASGVMNWSWSSYCDSSPFNNEFSTEHGEPIPFFQVYPQFWDKFRDKLAGAPTSTWCLRKWFLGRIYPFKSLCFQVSSVLTFFCRNKIRHMILIGRNPELSREYQSKHRTGCLCVGPCIHSPPSWDSRCAEGQGGEVRSRVIFPSWGLNIGNLHNIYIIIYII
jgi:hypothetical protein